jgi:hypothetical protein
MNALTTSLKECNRPIKNGIPTGRPPAYARRD